MIKTICQNSNTSQFPVNQKLKKLHNLHLIQDREKIATSMTPLTFNQFVKSTVSHLASNCVCTTSKNIIHSRHHKIYGNVKISRATKKQFVRLINKRCFSYRYFMPAFEYLISCCDREKVNLGCGAHNEKSDSRKMIRIWAYKDKDGRSSRAHRLNGHKARENENKSTN